MGLEQIIPTIFLISILLMIIPGFLRSNLKKKLFFKNLFIWSIIVVLVVVSSFLILK